MEIQKHGTSRILMKLMKAVDNGQYYEAHQMYRTIYFRYLESERYVELIDLLYNGSFTLLYRKQFTSGTDLGILLVDVLTKSKLSPTDTYINKVTNLFYLMDSNSPEREMFISKARNWTTINFLKVGHAELHKKFARLFWHEKDYFQARVHFLHSNDVYGYATMLVHLQNLQGFFSEIGLIIAHAILQNLCLRNQEKAEEIFLIYVKRHPLINEGPPFNSPLLNFLFYLLKIVKIGKTSMYVNFCKVYEKSISEDPTLFQYLDKIGHIFFEIQSSQTNKKGLFSSFLQTFFNDTETEGLLEDNIDRNRTYHTGPDLD